MINTILFDADLLQKHHPLRVETLHGLVDDGYNVGIISKRGRKETTETLKKSDVWLFIDLIVCYPECDPGESPWFTAISAFATSPEQTLCLVQAEDIWHDSSQTNAHTRIVKTFDITPRAVNQWIQSAI